MKFFSNFLFITVITLFTRVGSIENGEFISIKEAPFFAALMNEKDYVEPWAYCGAAIISERWVITAAHCIDWDSHGSKHLYFGGSNFKNLTRNRHLVEKHFVHPDWNNDFNTNHDIALIKLKHPIHFDEYQQSIRLHRYPLETGNIVTIYGIGNQGNARNGAPVLKKTEVQYLNESYCKSLDEDWNFPQGIFCADNNVTDACSGDSGGPAVYDGKLVGITSAGPECITMFYRTDDDLPASVYTRIDYFYDWIIEITGLKL